MKKTKPGDLPAGVHIYGSAQYFRCSSSPAEVLKHVGLGVRAGDVSLSISWTPEQAQAVIDRLQQALADMAAQAAVIQARIDEENAAAAAVAV